MSLSRLSEITQHLALDSSAGDFIRSSEDAYYLDSLIKELNKKLNNVDSDLDIQTVYAYLFDILNKFENVGTRFYSATTMSDANNAARYIPYAMLIAIFNYVVQAKHYIEADNSAEEKEEKYEADAVDVSSGDNILTSLEMPWIDDSWRSLSASIVHQLQLKNSDTASVKSVKKAFREIANRYSDEDNDQNDISLSAKTVDQAVKDLELLTENLTASGLLQEDDISIINSVLSGLKPLLSDKPLDAFGKHTLKNTLLPTIVNLRLQFSNQACKDKGFHSRAMAVPAMYLVEAVNERLNQAIKPFTPTSEDWNTYALSKLFADSFARLTKRFPNAAVFDIADEDRQDEEKQAVLGRCDIPVVYPSERDALIKIKNNRTRLAGGISIKQILALVWSSINDLPVDKQEKLKKSLSVELQKIGKSDVDLDPTEVIISLLRVVDGVHPDVKLSHKPVSDLESLVSSHVLESINTIVRNTTVGEGDVLSPSFSEEELVRLRDSIDHELAASFGFVWALGSNRIDLLNKLVTLQAIIDAQNRINKQKNKKLDISNADSLEDFVGPYIKRFIMTTVRNNQVKDVAEEKDQPPRYDFYRDPDAAIQKLKNKIDQHYAENLGLVWTWHPERAVILEKLVSRSELIKAQNIFNAVENKNIAVSEHNPLEDMLESIAAEFLSVEIQQLAQSKVVEADDEDFEDKEEKHQPKLEYSISDLSLTKMEYVFTNKFKLVWALREDTNEIMNRLFGKKAIERAIERQNQPTQKEIELEATVEELIAPHVRLFLINQLRSGEKFAGERVANVNACLVSLIDEANRLFKAEFAKKKLEWPTDEVAKGILAKLITLESVVDARNELNKQQNPALDRHAVGNMKALFAPHIAKILEAELKAGSPDLVLDEDNSPKAGYEEGELVNHHYAAPFVLRCQQLQDEVILALSKIFGVVALWLDESIEAIEALTSSTAVLAAQNRLNAEKDASLDIAVVGNVIAYFSQYVKAQVEAKIQSCYVVKDAQLEEIDADALDVIVAGSVSTFIDTEKADKMMTEKFGLLWTSHPERFAALNQNLSSDEIVAAKNTVLKNALAPMVRRHLDKTLYNEFYNKAQQYEAADKRLVDENVSFSIRVLGKAKQIVGAYLSKKIEFLWTENPARDELLASLVTPAIIADSQHNAGDKRAKQIADMMERAPDTRRELQQWIPILLERREEAHSASKDLLAEKENEISILVNNVELDEKAVNVENAIVDPELKLQRDQLQSEYQVIERNVARDSACVAALKKINERLRDKEQSLVSLKADYACLVSLMKREKALSGKSFSAPSYVKKLLKNKIERAYQALKEAMCGIKGIEKASDLLKQVETVMDQSTRFQNEKFVTKSYQYAYIGIVKKHKESTELTRQLEQAIDIFNDYASDKKGRFGYLYRIRHFRRNHVADARTIVDDLTSLIHDIQARVPESVDSAKVIQDAKDIIMNQVAELVKEGSLKLNFVDSSFARRASFVLNDVLSVAKLKAPVKVKAPVKAVAKPPVKAAVIQPAVLVAEEEGVAEPASPVNQAAAFFSPTAESTFAAANGVIAAASVSPVTPAASAVVASVAVPASSPVKSSSSAAFFSPKADSTSAAATAAPAQANGAMSNDPLSKYNEKERAFIRGLSLHNSARR